MNTQRLYKKNVYLSKCAATISDIAPDGIVLDRSVFFPEGGGQSSDIGTLTRTSDGAVFNVLHVAEDGQNILHQTDEHDLEIGDTVICSIDWSHRFDNMQRHCGEHLLSGVMYKLYGGINRGFHMGEHFMTADISLEGNSDFSELTWKMAMTAEEMINSYIWQNLPVKTYEFATSKEALQMPLRKELTLEDDIRVVIVGNDDDIADCVACCGTHPSSTAQIGLLKIYKVEKNKGMYRIYFEAGKRAMEDYRTKHDILTALANRYSTGIAELLHKIEKQEQKYEETKNSLNRLRSRLISEKTRDIKNELETGRSFISRFYDEFTPEDIMRIGKPILGDIRGMVAAGDLNTNTLILFSDGTNDCGRLIKDNAGIYSGKGGGRKDNARVLFPDRESMMLFTDALEKLLR